MKSLILKNNFLVIQIKILSLIFCIIISLHPDTCLQLFRSFAHFLFLGNQNHSLINQPLSIRHHLYESAKYAKYWQLSDLTIQPGDG